MVERQASAGSYSRVRWTKALASQKCVTEGKRGGQAYWDTT
jgi:hypothetical protein